MDDIEVPDAPPTQVLPVGTADTSKDASFLAFLANLKGVDGEPVPVRFFSRDAGSYFTVHGPDAELIADQFYGTSAVIKYLGYSRVPGVAVSHKMFEKIVTGLLLELRRAVEVWSGAGGAWTRTQQASPGNIHTFQHLLRNSQVDDTVTIMSLCNSRNSAGDVVVGVAFANTTTRQMTAYELVDPSLVHVEALAVRRNARECIMLTGTGAEFQQAKDVLTRAGVIVTIKPRALFERSDASSLLMRVFSLTAATTVPTSSFVAPGPTAAADPALVLSELQSKPQAHNAVAALTRHLGLDDATGTFKLHLEKLHDYVHINASAASAMALFPQSSKQMRRPAEAAGARCLFSLLNVCMTGMGSRLLRSWMLHPLTDVEVLNRRLDMVQLLVSDPILRRTLQDAHLKKMADVERIGLGFGRASGSLKELVTCYRVASGIPPLVETLRSSFGEDTVPRCLQSMVDALVESSSNLQRLQDLVEETIDLTSLVEHGRYLVKPSVHPKLQSLKDAVDHSNAAMLTGIDTACRKLSIPKDKVRLERNLQYGIVLRVPTRQQALLNKGKALVIRLATQAAGILFTTAEFRQCTATYQQALKEFTAAQQEVAKQIMEVAFTYAPVLQTAATWLAQLDVLVAFAHVATRSAAPYCRPVLNEHALRITGGRHPLLEVSPSAAVIPNSCLLSREGPRMALVSGPNMGGKSTFLCMVAQIAYLAHIGCFVPASDAHIPVLDGIYARVGASDNTLRGVSTFMAEMLETAAIVNAASSRSLVIVDELGRGTSTRDGFGVAWAVAEHLALASKCVCLFATHFHELAALGTPAAVHNTVEDDTKGTDEVPPITNLHVTAQVADGQVVMLYEVQQGPCDQSFGIHVAEMAKFPAPIVELATRKMAELQAANPLKRPLPT